MAHLIAEVVYRGIFQKNLAARITRGIVLSARKAGRWGIAFGRYGDSPQRNGIPAKDFAIVADTKEELEQHMARYEPKELHVTICVDDTLSKGVESWAWYGLQPINRLILPNGHLLMTSTQPPSELLKDIHKKDSPYNLWILPAKASFSGLWVYKEDHTEVRVLGALAKIAPELMGIDAVCQAIKEAEWGSDLKVESARKAYDRIEGHAVRMTEGNPETPYSFELPRWWEMREGVTIPAIPIGKPIEGGKGYHVDLEQGDGDPALPVWFHESRVIATPLAGRLRLAGTLELAGLDLTVDRRRVEAVVRAGREGLFGLADRRPIDVWRGLRPCSPDGLPIVGRPDGLENVVLATGHGMMGLTLAPVTARLVGEVVAAAEPSHDLVPLSPARFRVFRQRPY